MCDVICTVRFVHVVLLIYTVWGVDFKVQMSSFDVKLLGNQNAGARNSMHFRAIQDSAEDLNGPDSIHLRATDNSRDSASGHNIYMRASDESEERNPYMRARNATVQKRTSRIKPDCLYQYPQKKQMDLILSNMMNELTQIFVKANDWLKEKVTRQTRKFHNANAIRRALETRFRVSHRKRRDFFEDIYHNMTRNYRAFYNWTALRVMRSGQDACQHQKEIKKVWQDLLERSLDTLKKAIQHCIHEYLTDQKIHPDSNLGTQMKMYLVKEMRTIRSNQLKLLCDKFQLCYNETLQEYRWKTNLRGDEFRRAQQYDYYR